MCAVAMRGSCPRCEQQFVARYSGALTVAPDGRFTAPLYAKGVTVGNNCVAQDIRIEQISSITLGAQLGDEAGAGELTFQNLAAVDGDELKAVYGDKLDRSLTCPHSRAPSRGSDRCRHRCASARDGTSTAA